MKTGKVLLLLLCFLSASAVFAGDFTLGEAAVYKNLTVWPVSATRPLRLSDMITLDEGLENGTVQVRETGPAAESYNQVQMNNLLEDQVEQQVQQQQMSTVSSVNTLFVSNSSKVYLFITAGEIVKGGKQNRVASRDSIIPPETENAELKVYCVEKGRWTADTEQGESFSAGKGLVAQNMLRKTILGKADQSAVWSTVSKLNEEKGVSTGTENYLAGIENGQDSEEAARYAEALLKSLRGEQVCGLIAAINGRIDGLDIFYDPVMFKKQAEKILAAYSYDAVMKTDEQPPPTAADTADAETFLGSVLSADFHQAASSGSFQYLAVNRKGIIGGLSKRLRDGVWVGVHLTALAVHDE